MSTNSGMFRAFANRLMKTEWRGLISEVGCGVPFQHDFMLCYGASKNILYGESPYSKDFQHLGDIRSVSLEATKSHINRMISIRNNDYANTFYVSSVSKSSRVGGHGWVTLGWFDSDLNFKTTSVHWRTYDNRLCASNCCSDLIRLLIEFRLMGGWKTWKDFIDQVNKVIKGSISIDIIHSDDVTIEDHLYLLESENNSYCGLGNFLLYHNGEFRCPEEYALKSPTIYRGSFDPVTMAHQAIGQDSIFEICLANAHGKSYKTLEDIKHRIKMLDILGISVLISNKGCGLFSDFVYGYERMLRPYNHAGVSRTMKFVVGPDTFNAICDYKFYKMPPEFALTGFEVFKNSEFIVRTGDLAAINKNELGRALKTTQEVINIPNVRSVKVRDGDLTMVDSAVKDYIVSNNLYS